MGEWKVGIPSTSTGDLLQRLRGFLGASSQHRYALLEGMREFLPRYWGDREAVDWYLEAVQHAPQKASQLDALRARHGTLATQLWEVDLDDEAAVHSVVNQIRAHERREAALLTEIWYEEVGGEG